MAQHDMNIANQGFPAFRADLNSALTAIANNSSGATEPSTTFAYQWWYDTSTNVLKMRNADNDAWIEIGTFNQTTDSFTPSGVTSDTISEGNSSVEVVDSGTGYIQVVVDGVEVSRFNSSGIDVTGTVTADGLTVDGDGQLNQTAGNASTLTFTSNGQASRYSRIKVDTDRSLILTAGVGTVNETPDIKLQTGTATGEKDRILVDGATGDISFYEDTGTTAKFFWDASAESLGIGTSSPSEELHILANNPAILVQDADNTRTQTTLVGSLAVKDSAGNDAFKVGRKYGSLAGLVESTASSLVLHADGSNTHGSTYIGFTTDGYQERMRIDSSGNVIVGNTSAGSTSAVTFEPSGIVHARVNNSAVMIADRLSSDGVVVAIRQEGTTEGTIAVSGTTVSFTGGHLARWSRLPEGTDDSNILKGTVMTNLNEMVVWTVDEVPATYWEEGDELPEGVSIGDIKTDAIPAYVEDNEQLNYTAVSSSEGDKNIAGIFVAWDESDAWGDYFLAQTGDMIIRIAAGTTVEQGDLLLSAGDGTAKPQEDDLIRSSTVAKVISTEVTCTYDDGSYCVPCVIMAC